MPENSESELVARFKSGDLAVFNTLTRMWYEKILGLLYRILGDIEEAEDVCQKTFLAVYSRLHQLKDNDKFKPWIYKIASNYAMDQLRDRKTSFRAAGRPNDFEGTEEPPEADPVDLERRIDHSALRNIFVEMLGKLPADQKVVIVMKLYQDLKFTEIAEVLDVSINTVKTRMYTGLQSLKGHLQKNRIIEEILKNEM